MIGFKSISAALKAAPILMLPLTAHMVKNPNAVLSIL